MSATEKLNKIKELLFGAAPVPPAATPAPAPVPAAEPAKFQDYPTQDGTIVLSIDKLEVGGQVQIAGQPAPDGEYVLADGTNVQVAAGVIAELSSAAEDAIPEEMKNLPGKMSAIEEKFAAFEQEYTTLKSEFSAAKDTIGKQDQAIKGLLEVVQQLAELPKQEPAAAPASFRSQKDKASRLDFIAEKLKQIDSKK